MVIPMKNKPSVLPIPVNGELDAAVREAARKTGLSKASVLRQGLRFGIPKVVESFRDSAKRKRPACLDYLDDYPLAKVTAKESEAVVREKLRGHRAPHR